MSHKELIVSFCYNWFIGLSLKNLRHSLLPFWHCLKQDWQETDFNGGRWRLFSFILYKYICMHYNISRIPQEIVDRCAAMNAKTEIIQTLVDSMNNLAEIISDVEHSLAEIKGLIQVMPHYKFEKDVTLFDYYLFSLTIMHCLPWA